MIKWHDVIKNPNDLPEGFVIVLVHEMESGKVWKPKTARYDPEYSKWFDRDGNILDFDIFRIIAWT